ncbi:hypothetical protein ACFSVK_09805 [Azorhizophilus paspali]|uniref:hypothetical protein n=1 Tax=Azorhizophilus paspali TaxID=69963 RepID=UPI003639D99B
MPALQPELRQDPRRQARPGPAPAVAAAFPFAEPGYYVCWQDARAQLWIWDRAALRQRLPAGDRYSTLPDSALSLDIPLHEGERLVAGLHGQEWQRWQNRQLIDSRWHATPESGDDLLRLDPVQRTPCRPPTANCSSNSPSSPAPRCYSPVCYCRVAPGWI